MSSPATSFPFSVDLTHCLLTTLLDFQSLYAFISASKFIYSVFRYRQSSILGAVAQNQLGPALPQAMCLIWFLDGTHSLGSTNEAHREMGARSFMITPGQVRLLRDHATVVQTLEDVYSWREKDPRSKTSQLSAAESVRFRQSVYRFWLLSAAYGPGAPVDRRLEYSNYSLLKDLIIVKQTTFLSSLGKTEHFCVGEVHRFLLDFAKWAVVKNTMPTTRLGDIDDIYLVWGGPAVTLDAFKGNWPSFGPIDPQWYGTWRAMTHTFSSSITGERLSTIRQPFILDDHFLRTIDCSQCRGLQSPSRNTILWSICNWEYMIVAIPPSRLGSFLTFEGTRPLQLLASFTEAIESIPYSQLIEEIFDIRSTQYTNWKKDDWLCTRCMIQLLSDNIHAWFEQRTGCNY